MNFLLTPLIASLLSCAAAGPDVVVMATGPKFPAKPANCEIAFTSEDPVTVNLTFHIVAQIQVSGFDSGGRALSSELTPELRKILGPAACELGADTVSPGTSFAIAQPGGMSSSVTFMILRRRDEPLQPPPGMAPPGAAPPTQPAPPAPTAPPDTKAI